MENVKVSDRIDRIVQIMLNLVVARKNEYATPEHLLIAVCYVEIFDMLAEDVRFDKNMFLSDLLNYIDSLDKVEEENRTTIMVSMQYREMMEDAELIAKGYGKDKADLVHVIEAMLKLENSHARYVLCKYFGTDNTKTLAAFAKMQMVDDFRKSIETSGSNEEENDVESGDDDVEFVNDTWRRMCKRLDATNCGQVQLVGREAEMERLIQILGRKEKNNVLLLGEHGVGKTALVHALVKNIESGDVPLDLFFNQVYEVDITSLIAGAQMRGEFEKRFKMILDGASREQDVILFFDEIHSMASVGQPGDGSVDAMAILRPYLEGGAVRIIGSTTYQEYNRCLTKNKGAFRLFQQVDVCEPSVEETLQIVEKKLGSYEEFHEVKYNMEAVRYAVEKSAALISDRFLPDKAIDVIDEAGSYRKMKPLINKKGFKKAKRFQTVDVAVMKEVLAKVCKINAKALSEESNEALMNLTERITSQIYGQDEAVKYVVDAVQMAKAGLLEPEKPLASLLFVGPTGVGKTEVCKVLAKELGIELVRFDMSEYTEKHTVAKLIGSPAGYIGYEDGGLLTDAIRKTPNCVLLLDEIEKAHSDIYNILLQVMDYAKLTDNRGNKADFRNVILIMTSNAGAQYSNQATIGFDNKTTRGEAMLQTVKKTFKPEFINRLSGTVVFNDMDMTMATQILDKKLAMLADRLSAKDVTLTLTDDAKEYLLQKGFTKQYGAREMDRVVHNSLYPLLVKEILFGKLKNGGTMTISKKELVK